ncbi:unnamed protein product [Didymodactylos carnosus]|uniref:Uncharacterized protein n=1 Tax=Didymodactylos carnosus TaxID=1234261 RepID=A0A815PLX8_9BILA|nr:unnamed protein product [Didymodactylos carnosus]CAF1450637.1 unnamed protein product [Didymodactylos carnosus]CAF3558691.1 unnamed protein product [Didymodactylos carnosus]CAF4324086.1 unnamed protein product [Didymodactylos carnosus]
MSEQQSVPVYTNAYVTCYDNYLVIHDYYFPFGNKKIIKYADIDKCELGSIKELGFFKIKSWGMALSPIWWPADLYRHTSREKYILLDTQQWPKIGLTMNDNEIDQIYYFILSKTSTKHHSNEPTTFDDTEVNLKKHF